MSQYYRNHPDEPISHDWVSSAGANKTIPCKICGRLTNMLGTKLCDPCWEVTHRVNTYVVLNTQSKAFCQFPGYHLDEALAFFHDGIARGESYVMLSLIKGNLP